jgi:genome maintenance exonuclease 1
MLQGILQTRKQFIHLPSNSQSIELEQINTETGRYYKTPAGLVYPSVTTVTGLHSVKHIKEWRKRVGEEEANKVTKAATTRGTRVHKLLEDYINNDDIDHNKYDFNDAINFKLLKPILDERIDNVRFQEERMYSDFLQLAGTVDCVAEYNGKLAVIDFKTARKAKDKDQIKNYFMQAAAYAIMHEERYLIPINRLIILISVDDDQPQVFEERRDNYTKDLLSIREEYRRIYNI